VPLGYCSITLCYLVNLYAHVVNLYTPCPLLDGGRCERPRAKTAPLNRWERKP